MMIYTRRKLFRTLSSPLLLIICLFSISLVYYFVGSPVNNEAHSKDTRNTALNIEIKQIKTSLTKDMTNIGDNGVEEKQQKFARKNVFLSV